MFQREVHHQHRPDRKQDREHHNQWPENQSPSEALPAQAWPARAGTAGAVGNLIAGGAGGAGGGVN